MTKEEWVLELAKIIFGLIFMISLTACSQQAGWAFGFGIYPVNGVNQNQTFDSAKVKKVTY